ncbi:hypothetical protein C4J81_10025 [Deltaproteobacteria bacterium Smac51]|nr:hypothetical protein C4J81_10025 [Deltaproteobacteria bacterium Smac51]
MSTLLAAEAGAAEPATSTAPKAIAKAFFIAFLLEAIEIEIEIHLQNSKRTISQKFRLFKYKKPPTGYPAGVFVQVSLKLKRGLN